MNSNLRLNLLLLAGVVLIIGVNVAAFSYSYWASSFDLFWNDFLNAHFYRPAAKAGDRTMADCLKVNDFYSARLTTYFRADSDDSAGGRIDDMSKYAEYCDRVPGTGRVIFSVTLIEEDVRGMPVALSFYKLDQKGARALLTSLPAKPHPTGFVTLDSPVSYRGKYLLELAFNEGKSAEDKIEMPISVGE
ncbi:hypothetical protein [Methylosinus sp. Sm6]|uniref:hypothetical protein n=1 Tax=Methylosinus sp. Sm6 TaxID=2866948 RepID=UPI001C9A2205|nr:hypothetical protein [Methylosinus sp. Sm6]MBY6242662.1 hypothetical protein [Methylosinus sp. Sm6]